MLKNYLVIAIRNLFRHKGYSIINILGLAIGLMACLFIVLYIYDEFKYDRHHSKGEDIYRLIVEYKDQNGGSFPIPLQAYRIKDELETEFPEMEEITRVTFPYEAAFEYQENQFKLRTSAVDDDFFEIFDVEVLEGSVQSSLNGSNSILISKSSAEKLFGEEEPMGKIIEMYTNIGTYPVEVGGVFQDFPRTSHFHLDVVFSTRISDNIFNDRQLNSWGEGMVYLYTYIPDYVDIENIESRFPAFVEKARGEGSSENVGYLLQPLLDIHLKSHYRFEIEANGDIRYVYIFGMVALFILLIAAFNYMNLSTARSIRRSKEVGVRKVTGASKIQLTGQFLGEAVIFTFIAMWIAVLLAELFLPYFNNLSGKSLEIDIFNDWKLLGLLVIASVFI
ncbi:MAG: ABC transporter permease, partial [Bacteroidales bacterium]